MKKIFYFSMAVAATFAFTACEKTGNGNQEETDPNFTENEGSFTYYGETYKTVTLENGSVWMAEPLRYVPEGLTPSENPADASAHIWYPYSISEDGTAVAATDEETIQANGYLYDLQAVFGSEITADNCGSFEGVQGICPKGWHIPTRADYLALCGYSNKTDETGAAPETDETAQFYDAGYNGGKVSSFNDAGWNFVLSDWMQRANFGAEGKYANTPVLSESNCSVETFYGKPALTYYMTSTLYKPVTDSEGELSNIQFFSLMTTFTKTYMEGRVHLAYASSVAGQQVRCVKDTE